MMHAAIVTAAAAMESVFLIKRGGSVVVFDSRPGTPATQAGIVKGDVIDSIDGTSANTMLLGDIRNVLAQPAGTVVTLT